MPPDPLILAFDTSAAHCAAALRSGNTHLGARIESMKKGQADHLIPMLEDMLAAQDLGWSDLSGIAVGIGPGNFTGIRISVAAARGLALALGIPAIGVSQFDAVSLAAPKDTPHWVLVAGPRESFYAQYRSTSPTDPVILSRAEGDALDAPVLWRHAVSDTDFISRLAEVGLSRLADPKVAPPAPLYVRKPDAALPSEPPILILDDA